MSESQARRWPRGQRDLRTDARASYLQFEWPSPVSVASKGYAGSGGAWCFVARTTLELVALVSHLPGIKHWSARSVVYVGRSGREFIAVRLRSTWFEPPRETIELWRTRLDDAVVTPRTFGYFSLVEFGGRPVWIETSDLDGLLASAA